MSEYSEAILASGLAVGAVSGGTVIAAGIIAVGGILLFAKIGETIGDITKSMSKRKKYTVCCCNKVGPSGEYMCHNIHCKSRKDAEDKARHFHNANGVIEHSGHFHAARNGVKISGYHFIY